MISGLFILSLLSGFSGAILSRERYARFVSFLIATISLALLCNLFQNMQDGFAQPAIWSLLDYKQIHINLNLSSNAHNYSVLFPFLIMTFLSLLYTYFVPKEERRGRLSSLMLVSSAFLMLPICSDNFVVLVVGSSLCGISGIYIINDFSGKKNYVFYTLVADMSLFAAMGIIYSSTSNTDLDTLSYYAQTNQHTELTSLLLLLGIGIKSGLFLFHNQIFSYANLKFNRLIFMNYCVAPACGLVIFSKTAVLLSPNHIGGSILLILSFCSILYGVIGGLIYDNLKEKALCLNMLLWGFFFAVSILFPIINFSIFSWIFVLFFLINLWIAMVSQSCSEEIYISRLGGTWKKLPQLLLIAPILTVALSQQILTQVDSCGWLGWGLIVILLVIIPYLMHQIFLGRCECDEMVWAFMHSPSLFLLFPLYALPLFLIFQYQFSWELVIIFAIVILLTLINPLQVLSNLYERDDIQLSDFFERFYEVVLLAPLSILGRVLWLTVDFLLIERTILSSILHFRNILINFSAQMHSCQLIGYLLTIGLGLGIILILGVIY